MAEGITLPRDPSQPARSVQEQGGVLLSRSFEVNVRELPAVAQELGAVAKDLRVMLDRTTRMGVTTEDIRRLVPTSEMVYQGVARALAETMATAQRQVTATPESPAAPPGRDPSWWRSRAPQEPSAGPGEISPASQGRLPRLDHQGYPEGRVSIAGQYQQGRSHPLGHLRQQLARSAFRRISEMGPSLGTDEAGALRVLTSTGTFGDLATPAQARGARVAGALKGLAGEVAEGQGIVAAAGAALPGLARLAGPVGAAIGGVKLTTDFAERQRAQAAEYQQILGGTAAEGLAERQRQRLFGFEQMGTLSGAQAEQLYQGVVGTGVRGADQQRFMQFGVQAYRQFGMSMGESIELLRVASRRGMESLGGLSDALEGVTRTARDAGVNAQAMRQQFVESFETISTQVGTRAAVGVARAVTEAAAGLGRPFQDVSFAGMTGTTQLRMAAAGGGMSLAQFEAMSLRDRSGASIATAITQQARRFTAGALGPQAQRLISSLSGRKVTQEEIDDVTAQVLETGVDPQAVQMILAQVGIQASLKQAVPTLISLQSGAYDPGARARATAVDAQVRTLGRGQRLEAARQFTERQHARGVRGQLWGDLGKKSVARHYGEIIEKRGRESKVIEKLIADFDPARTFRVKTASGDRIVTLDEGLDFYRDQFERGDVEIMEGTGSGQTIAEAVGLSGGDPTVQAISATRKAKAGMTQARWDERHKGKEETSGKVTIEASSELQRWFRFTGTGIASTEPSDLLVPPNPHTTADALPTGNE